MKEQTLRELVATQLVNSARLVGVPGGFELSVRLGDRHAVLETVRGLRRVFTNLNTAAKFLGQLGITRFEVDAAEFEPMRLRPPRPDRAAALRKTRTRPQQSNLL